MAPVVALDQSINMTNLMLPEEATARAYEKDNGSDAASTSVDSVGRHNSFEGSDFGRSSCSSDTPMLKFHLDDRYVYDTEMSMLKECRRMRHADRERQRQYEKSLVSEQSVISSIREKERAKAKRVALAEKRSARVQKFLQDNDFESISEVKMVRHIIHKRAMTPLHVAAKMDDYGMLRMLLAEGADVGAAFAMQVTPLDIAQKKASKDVIAFMQKVKTHAFSNNSFDSEE